MRRWGWLIWTLGALVVLSIAGYLIAGSMVRSKVDAALNALPPGLQAKYTILHFDLFKGTMRFEDVHIRDSTEGHVYAGTIDRVAVDGLHFFELARTKKLRAQSLRVEGIRLSNEKMKLDLEGRIEADSVYGSEQGEKGFGWIHLWVSRLHTRIPHAEQTVSLSNLEFDSRTKRLTLDTLRLEPTIDRERIGQQRGHQVDVFEVESEGIEADGLDWKGLQGQRFDAERINIRHNLVHVYRDRRLPLEKGDKPMPVQALRELPVALRVGSVHMGPSTFVYEEIPKNGGKPGRLIVDRMKMRIEPLINRPHNGDAAYLTLYSEGSLMNSGTVSATTRMPLHKGEPYEVEGVFHDLDVTSLNNPAENLGNLHLESGMLNQLNFHFEMSEERSTGLVTGRYHELVVDKLKKNGKVDKFKSFMLKHLIIPKNKETAKGKVNYKRDPERFFSYYLLHSLLVGVKSSFSLGFLLPG